MKIMPLRLSNLVSFLLLAGGLAFGRSGMDGPNTGFNQTTKQDPSGQGGQALSENARQVLQRAESNTSLIQSKFQLQNVPEAAPILQTLQNELAQARDAMAAGNFQAVISLCNQTETQIALLHNLGSRQFTEHGNTSVTDTAHLADQQKAKAQWDLQMTAEHFDLMARKLQENKSPNVSELIEKGRSFLDRANKEISQNHFDAVHPLLDNVEALIMELGRFTETSGDLENHGVSGTLQDSHKNQQPAAKSALAQATEIYNRVHDRVVRLSDQNKSEGDSKSAALFTRILDMLEKCHDALANGQSEAAKELALKAEALLTDWHQGRESVDGGSKGSSGSSLERLKVKLDRATEIVAASKNEKASRILEKGMEHFERAEHGQSEGQAARAQVEMDIALKLAAKAVDIARFGQNR